MKVLSYTEARANFAKTLDAVVDDAEEAVIHRAGHEPVVLVSLATWSSMQETEYLLRDPVNADMLRRSIADADAGRLTPHDLIDPDTVDEVA